MTMGRRPPVDFLQGIVCSIQNDSRLPVSVPKKTLQGLLNLRGLLNDESLDRLWQILTGADITAELAMAVCCPDDSVRVRLGELRVEKDQAVREQQFERAAALRDEQIALLSDPDEEVMELQFCHIKNVLIDHGFDGPFPE